MLIPMLMIKIGKTGIFRPKTSLIPNAKAKCSAIQFWTTFFILPKNSFASMNPVTLNPFTSSPLGSMKTIVGTPIMPNFSLNSFTDASPDLVKSALTRIKP